MYIIYGICTTLEHYDVYCVYLLYTVIDARYALRVTHTEAKNFAARRVAYKVVK